jgi:uncharacterized protein (DUF362 family)
MGATLSLGNYFPRFVNAAPTNPTPYDLIALKNAEPDKLFDRGIDLLGGMQGFVKKGQTVVVKPNMGWDVAPERAANTNPKLVKRIVEHCFNAGAKTVYVFDHTSDNWQRSYRNSGIAAAAKDAGATVTPAHSEGYYQTVDFSSGKRLEQVKEHELILEADVFINVPIMNYQHQIKDLELVSGRLPMPLAA